MVGHCAPLCPDVKPLFHSFHTTPPVASPTSALPLDVEMIQRGLISSSKVDDDLSSVGGWMLVYRRRRRQTPTSSSAQSGSLSKDPPSSSAHVPARVSSPRASARAAVSTLAGSPFCTDMANGSGPLNPKGTTHILNNLDSGLGPNNTRRDKMRNENIRTKIGVTLKEGRMRENHLRWFDHV